jgi:hypothetical protein
MCSFNDSDEKKKKLEYLSHMLDSFTQILPKNKQFFLGENNVATFQLLKYFVANLLLFGENFEHLSKNYCK